MIVEFNTENIEPILSRVVEHLDYDVWKEYFIVDEDEEADADRKESLEELQGVFLRAVLEVHGLD